MQLRKSVTFSAGVLPGWGGRRGQHVRRIVLNLLIFVLITLFGLLFLAPFAWMVSASLKTLPEIQKVPQPLLPEVPQWSNYWVAWTSLPFTQWFVNTLVITLANIAGTLLS